MSMENVFYLGSKLKRQESREHFGTNWVHCKSSVLSVYGRTKHLKIKVISRSFGRHSYTLLLILHGIWRRSCSQYMTSQQRQKEIRGRKTKLSKNESHEQRRLHNNLFTINN